MAYEEPFISTSALRSITGSTGPAGNPQRGTGGTAGPTGAQGQQGGRGPRGSTGIMLKRTEWDEENKRWNLIFAPFEETGEFVSYGPTGLTGNDGHVIGHPPTISNVGGNFAVVTGATSGTIVGPGSDPYWTHGISGTTLSFRKLGVSGDLVFYTDERNRIGTGPTYDMIGISGPSAAIKYGTVTGQSVGELIYLTDVKNVKDAYGLTFNENATIASAGFVAGGLTWGTIQTTFYNTSSYFHVHGNPLQGVTDPNFIINLNQGSSHVVYTPFTLRGITYDKHSTKKPISVAPSWTQAEAAEIAGGVATIGGETASYGEATSATLIVKSGPFGANFSNNFYFPANSNQLGEGTNIINCLTYDEGVSWLCSIVGTNFGYTGNAAIAQSKGSCCNSNVDSVNYGDCREYQTLDECNALEDYTFYENQPCENTPCVNIITEIGSCCVNRDPNTNGQALCLDQTQTTRTECQVFGGTWRAGIPCGPSYPCGNPCDDEFGQVGSCCKYDENGRYLRCEDDTTFEECSAYGSGEDEEDHFSVFGGYDSFCVSTDCCSFIEEYGACCLDAQGTCVDDQMTPQKCSMLGGIYQGHDTTCASIVCACDPGDQGGGDVCFDPTEVGVCCYGCLPSGCTECSCSQCLSSGGTYLGTAYDCSDNPCGIPDGGGGPGDPVTAACCLCTDGISSCSNRTATDCAAIGGEWDATNICFLNGHTCNPCEPDDGIGEGGGSGIGEGGTDGGAAGLLPPGAENEWACCSCGDPNSEDVYSCTNTLRENCLGAGQVFFEGETCGSTPYPCHRANQLDCLGADRAYGERSIGGYINAPNPVCYNSSGQMLFTKPDDEKLNGGYYEYGKGAYWNVFDDYVEEGTNINTSCCGGFIRPGVVGWLHPETNEFTAGQHPDWDVVHHCGCVSNSSLDWCNCCEEGSCSDLYTSHSNITFECQCVKSEELGLKKIEYDCEPDDPCCNQHMSPCLGVCTKITTTD